ncbi:hypothetical protein HDU84_002816, partial [Entophlyctis sp. JEL0112]
MEPPSPSVCDTTISKQSLLNNDPPASSNPRVSLASTSGLSQTHLIPIAPATETASNNAISVKISNSDGCVRNYVTAEGLIPPVDTEVSISRENWSSTEDGEKIQVFATGESSTGLVFGETYFGHVDDEADALTLIEAARKNLISAFSGTSVDMAQLKVRSGSVIVVPETCRFVKRWK